MTVTIGDFVMQQQQQDKPSNFIDFEHEQPNYDDTN